MQIPADLKAAIGRRRLLRKMVGAAAAVGRMGSPAWAYPSFGTADFANPLDAFVCKRSGPNGAPSCLATYTNFARLIDELGALLFHLTGIGIGDFKRRADGAYMQITMT
jgi:hypothetical protein